MQTVLNFQPEIEQALAADEPVVALESTVITHGLPYPKNVETAVLMEESVQSGGAHPATIALIQGQIYVGLTHDQMDYLGQQAGQNSVRKCSRRDLSLAMARSEDGSTTVAGTMILAHRAGIPIFATGGIGGVHRGHAFDISADLTELGRTPMVVVCSGAKSILDLPATREVLETQGVTIVGYGADELPAFYARSSGLPVDIRLDTPEDVANVMRARQTLGLQSGMLVTVPVPETEAMDTAAAEAAILQATREADEQGIHGSQSTPWLLSRMVALTNGRSMRANVALLKNNGRVAGQIAMALAS
ncbi:MAG: pseudouridine-5'-phosphate glycosidase [Anaerolineales bacterium]|nr:pseudouridine-5'-phosphate glycosidase [Anaerolineales bacterium]